MCGRQSPLILIAYQSKILAHNLSFHSLLDLFVFLSNTCVRMVPGAGDTQVTSAHKKTESTRETGRELDTVCSREPLSETRHRAAVGQQGDKTAPLDSVHLATADAVWEAGTLGRHHSSCLPPHQTPSPLARHIHKYLLKIHMGYPLS